MSVVPSTPGLFPTFTHLRTATEQALMQYSEIGCFPLPLATSATRMVTAKATTSGPSKLEPERDVVEENNDVGVDVGVNAVDNDDKKFKSRLRSEK